MTGAIAMAVPGCPEFACCTASMDKVRMVLMQSWSIFPSTDSDPGMLDAMSFLSPGRRGLGSAFLVFRVQTVLDPAAAVRALDPRGVLAPRLGP
jgi:hypothetical protein